MNRATQEYKELLNCIELPIDFGFQTNLIRGFTRIAYELNSKKIPIISYYKRNRLMISFELPNLNVYSDKVLRYAISRFNSLELYERKKNEILKLK